MNANSSISHTVMRRVRAIHLLRAVSSVAMSAALLALALYTLGREVWVAKVFANMPSLVDVPATLSFFANAFLRTDLLVQILSIIVLATAVWLFQRLAAALLPEHSLRAA